MIEVWDMPMYSPTTAARLAHLSAGRVRRWLMGYSFSYAVGVSDQTRVRQKEPVIRRNGNAETSSASFLDLIDLLFVKSFLDYGITLQRLRKALAEADDILGGHHFSHRNFFTDGKNVFLEVKDSADALLELLSGGQWVIAPIIRELAHQIEFDKPTGYAQRWYPSGPEGLIVVDPKISFGKPIIEGRGIATSSIHDFYVAEREDVGLVCDWMNISESEVEAAVRFEANLRAA